MLTIRRATADDYGKLYAKDKYMSENWQWRGQGFDAIAGPWRGMRWIEAGAGRGRFAAAQVAAGWHWTATDPFPAAPHVMSGGFPVLPFADGAFDCAATVDVLEHLDEADAIAALREMRRVSPIAAVCAIANMSDVHAIEGEAVEIHLTQRPAAWWQFQAENLGACARIVPIDGCAIRFWLVAEWRK